MDCHTFQTKAITSPALDGRVKILEVRPKPETALPQPPSETEELKRREDAIAKAIVLCLSLNVIATTVCWIRNGGGMIISLAVIYALIGCLLSYLLWYRPLYRAMRTNNGFSFSGFFLSYLLRFGFCIVDAIAPPTFFHGKSLKGILAASVVLSYDDVLLGILYLVGFGLVALLSLWVFQWLQKLYMYLRGNK